MDIYLIDGTYELFRYFYAVPSSKNASGQEIGAVRGVDEKPRSSWFGPCLSGRPNIPESGDRFARTESSTMTAHTMKILTDEVSASLNEVADAAPRPGVSPDHLAKLASVRQISLDQVSLHDVSVAHVAMIENGSHAAGDGMMRIMEIE